MPFLFILNLRLEDFAMSFLHGNSDKSVWDGATRGRSCSGLCSSEIVATGAGK